MTMALLDTLKEAGQDFEWYPTTSEMIAAVARQLELHKPVSILDIGAGDGRVLTALAGTRGSYVTLYAIEKAPIHLENMPANIAVVGTDFTRDTLIDKKVDVIFCNPPYSEYEDWAVKIIKEGLCGDAYLVLPKRWFDSPVIKAALSARQTQAKVIWSGNFHRAERQARAEVDIIRVRLVRGRLNCDDRPQDNDPFDLWFSETFPEVGVLETLKDETNHAEKRIGNELLAGYNLVDRLAELYRKDMDKMYASYRALCSIDPAILATVGVKIAEVKAGLKAKIAGFKNLYWKELFDHLDKVKQRLATKSREHILEKMNSAVHVDFTEDNAYAVVLWVLKNANEYIDSQLTDLFKQLSNPESTRNYKSNQKTYGAEQWRYLRGYACDYGKTGAPTHYALEYRVIVQQWHGHAVKPNDKEWHSDYDYPGGLHRDSHNMLNDIITVANNLGFACSDGPTGRLWESGRAELFHLDNGEVLMRVRAFCNGNLHIQFHQGFIKALNVEASRLLGWIKTPREAVEEMGIDFAAAQRHFRCNRLFVASEYKLLTA